MAMLSFAPFLVLMATCVSTGHLSPAWQEYPDKCAARHVARRGGTPRAYDLYETAASLALRMKARSLGQSFVPGVASTPLQTSTAYGRTVRMASRTFSGVSPPANIMR